MQFRLVYFISLLHFSSQCVQVYYVEQPRSDLNCSPYNSVLQEWTLRLRCIVKTIDLDASSVLDVFWYRRRMCDDVVQNLGTGVESQNNPFLKTTELTEIAGLSNTPFSEEMPGDYWCQAEIKNSSGTYFLTGSDNLTIMRPENYAEYEECVNVQSQVIGQRAEYTTNVPAPPILNQSSECKRSTDGHNVSVNSTISRYKLQSTQSLAIRSSIAQGRYIHTMW